MKKSFYTKDEKYTQEALDFSAEIHNAVKQIMSAWASKGHSIREMSHLAQSEVSCIELDYILDAKNTFKT